MAHALFDYVNGINFYDDTLLNTGDLVQTFDLSPLRASRYSNGEAGHNFDLRLALWQDGGVFDGTGVETAPVKGILTSVQQFYSNDNVGDGGFEINFISYHIEKYRPTASADPLLSTALAYDTTSGFPDIFPGVTKTDIFIAAILREDDDIYIRPSNPATPRSFTISGDFASVNGELARSFLMTNLNAVIAGSDKIYVNYGENTGRGVNVNGTVAGDALSVGLSNTAVNENDFGFVGGNDTIYAFSDVQNTIYGDVAEVNLGNSGIFTGGDDIIDARDGLDFLLGLGSNAILNAPGNYYGDAFSVGGSGLFKGGDDFILGADSVGGGAPPLLIGDALIIGGDATYVGGDDVLFGGSVGENLVGDFSDTRLLSANGSVTGGKDSLYGNGGDDSLEGNGGDDILDGGAGRDSLDGGSGLDMMSGGDDNDTYLVDNIGDVVTENANEGDDTVFTSVSYNVPANVEVLIMHGNGDLNSTGTAVRDQIFGNSGNNIIDGAGGFDVMQGFAGDDTYAVDHSMDAVIEAAGEGYDNVYSSIDYAIDENQEIESALLTGNAVVLRGSNSNNQLIGNDQVNVIDGRGGSDYMLGGLGDDIFQISPENGAVDVIGDFSNGTAGVGDRIAFSGFGAATTTVIQVSATSFEVRDSLGTGTTADDVVQQFQLLDAYGASSYTGGNLMEGDDYYFA